MEDHTENWFSTLQKHVTTVCGLLEYVGLAALACMVIVAVVDVLGAKLFKWPVPGSTEITGLLQVVAISAGLAFSKIDGRQIYVGFLMDSLKGRPKTVLEEIRSILSLGFWAVASVMVFKYGLALAGRGAETFLLGIPLSPFAFWVAVVACAVMCVLIILDIIRPVAHRGRTGGTA
ncbi:MAG: TRAP transporter small permease [Actinobacteria bacterium]|jgi:TRAP-type C4-dicarboxylate transport system permease small subunit|nr:TRAP transporter small permease [Actinomycetota bacterium]